MRDERCFRLMQALNFVDAKGNAYAVGPDGTIKLRVSTRSSRSLSIGQITQDAASQRIIYTKKIQPEKKHLYRLKNAWAVSQGVLDRLVSFDALICYVGEQGRVYEIFADEAQRLGEYISWPGQEPMRVVPISLWRLRQA